MRLLRTPLVLVLLVVVVSVAACGTAASTASAAAAGSGASTQTSDRAGVTVAVTWGGASAGGTFDVKLDNHMMDLASVKLESSTLTNDRGERLSAPRWDGGAAGHHRDGSLSFGDASPAFFAGAHWVELELPAVGDAAPRDFRWALS